MIEIVFSALLYYSLFFVAASAIRPIKIETIAFSVIYLLILLALAVVNFELNLIEQKFASTFAYERYLGIETHINGNFLFQAWVSSLAYFLTHSWQASIGVNLALFAGLALLMDRLRFVYILLFLSPAIVHISIFALRDVIMAATMFFFCLYVLAQKRPNILVVIFMLVILYMQRPELIGVILITYGAIYFREFSVVQKTALIIFLVLCIVLVLPKLPILLGLPAASSILTLPDVLLTFSQARADRWTNTDGSDTAILSGGLTAIPFLLRYPIQVFAFFISPLPIDFKGFSSLVFAIDSVIFVWILRKFWKLADRRHKIFLMVYILTSAFFMANYGNLFRVRMPCYLIMFSGFLVYYRSLPENPEFKIIERIIKRA